MVCRTAGAADLTARRPFDEFFIGDGNVDDAIEFDAQIAEDGIKGYSLAGRAREAVEDEAFFAVILGEAFFDDAYGNSVRYELAVVHVLLGFEAERGLFFYSCPEHVACRNLGNTIFFNQSFSLGTFTSTRRAH